MPVLADVLVPGLRFVFCGTAAGARSAELGFPYAGPGNKFWWVLEEISLTPRRLAPEEFHSLPEFGIGLTDLAKHASGADSSLRQADFDPEMLRRKIEAVQPGVLAFNGKRSAQQFFGGQVEYGEQPVKIGSTRVFVLPSTSGAANGYWDIGPWWDLSGLDSRRPRR